MARWECTICGYFHEVDAPPDVCPVCNAGPDAFVRLDDEASETASDRTVSDVLVETMVNWGVTHVFGMVGHSNLGIAEAVRKQEAAGKLRFVGIRHEGAAAFAASAYTKLTGQPAACLSIAGPGATNLLTGLWDAKVDRAPVLALTGQVDAQVLGPGAFQELDLDAAFQAVAAWSQTVLHSSNYAELMTLALKHATLERDVAHLILPDEIQVQPVDVWATDLVNPDFATYANTCGALGIRVSKASQLDEALRQAFAHAGPVLVEVMTDPELV